MNTKTLQFHPEMTEKIAFEDVNPKIWKIFDYKINLVI